MAKKKSLFSIIKRLFISDTNSKLEKKEKRKRWIFRLLKIKQLPTLSAPYSPPREIPHQEQSNIQSVHEANILVQVSHQHDKAFQDLAAIKVQAVFRGYLARKALGALKGVVKLQALIRGWAVRKQAINTLKCLQSIVNIQSQVCSNNLHSQEYTTRDPREKDIKRSAETERDKVYGRRRYWLEQWVDAQLAKQDYLTNFDTNSSANARNKDEVGGRELNLRHPQKQISPTNIPERLFHHRKQRSIGNDNSFPDSPAIPTYMAFTESAKAKARSTSSPRLRPISFDACSEIASPYKHKFSPISSINSELTSRSWIGNHNSTSLRSPRLKGSPGPVRSDMSIKDLHLQGIHQ
ncbi:hypothetical protein RD792_004452 [Penstemon davidsonii]|uniref:DUF4005 domain-containing protein n=1 Tax=Penstemon davidsonii TaxID=160366 RepID=A0ABR0DIM3_9LAMI|nr:hypothetical protein RD792_004452 [Penstemon davidsonii]